MTVSSGQPRITVIGIGPSPLGNRAEARLAAATLVVGARRHLTAAGLPPPIPAAPGPVSVGPMAPGQGAPRPARPGVAAPSLPSPAGTTSRRRIVELAGDLEPALAALDAAGGPSVVLASGDPGFFGVVRVLAERFGRHRLEVLPSVSSVAAAFAAAGLPWDDALVVIAHGRDPNPVVHACLAHPKVAVLTQPGFGPAELAARLAGSGRRLLVAERLGEPDQRVVEGEPATIEAGRWADPNVVLVLDRDPLACKLVAANAERHGVAVQVVGGTAPEALVALPYPDAVFVGGGGDALEAVLRLVAARTRRVVVVALTGADGHARPGRVLLAARTLAAAGMDVGTVRLHASRFQTTTELRESLATNPVYLVSGTRP